MDRKGNAVFVGAAILIAVVVVIAVVLVAFVTALPDVNSNPSNSIGYFDSKATVYFGLNPGCNYATGQGCQISAYILGDPYNPKVTVEEHLTQPSGPATIYGGFHLGTVSQTCKGWAVLTVAGPGISQADPPTATSPSASFGMAQAVTFSFGHLYVAEEGAYSLTFDIHIDGCYLYAGEHADSVYYNFEFDGVNGS